MESGEYRQEDIPKIDSVRTPSIYVDGIHGLMVHDGMVTLNFTETLSGVPGSELEGPRIKAVVKVHIPAVAFARMSKYWKNAVGTLIEQGVISEDEVTEQSAAPTSLGNEQDG